MTYETREQWLTAAAERLSDLIAEHTDLEPAKRVHVSTGFPRRDRGGRVIGQCWNSKSSAGVNHIFIHPTLPSPVTVLPVLLHELIHAADDCKSSHVKAFRKAWKALGFIGKPTESTPSKELAATLKAIAKDLGPYPHTALQPGDGPKKQSTRMLKVACSEGSGYIVRMTRKWLDDLGEPKCPCHDTKMEEAA